MDEIKHQDTRVLLIGSGQFPEGSGIDDIPNVDVNVERFQQILTDKGLIGIPAENIIVSLNEDRIKIEKKLKTIVEGTRNKKYTLIVYYTGHGIMSSVDYKMYLTTTATTLEDLEIHGLNIEGFRGYISRSLAGRKIVIIDCCHSGAIIGSMNTMSSQIQGDLNEFEGTYVMTSAAEDMSSLFPLNQPDMPTYFTGKIMEVIREGIDIDQEFCSVREVFEKARTDLVQAGMPSPQQSNFKNADQLTFCRNKKRSAIFLEAAAWEDAVRENRSWLYLDFLEKFPQSLHSQEANRKLQEAEEEEIWQRALNRNIVTQYIAYLNSYPQGKYREEARLRISRIKKEQEAVIAPVKADSPLPPVSPTPSPTLNAQTIAPGAAGKASVRPTITRRLVDWGHRMYWFFEDYCIGIYCFLTFMLSVAVMVFLYLRGLPEFQFTPIVFFTGAVTIYLLPSYLLFIFLIITLKKRYPTLAKLYSIPALLLMPLIMGQAEVLLEVVPFYKDNPGVSIAIGSLAEKFICIVPILVVVLIPLYEISHTGYMRSSIGFRFFNYLLRPLILSYLIIIVIEWIFIMSGRHINGQGLGIILGMTSLILLPSFFIFGLMMILMSKVFPYVFSLVVSLITFAVIPWYYSRQLPSTEGGVFLFEFFLGYSALPVVLVCVPWSKMENIRRWWPY